MVRAPCCEKMGLKKGPWTPEEDNILISYIQKNGHGNWRALPKQAGLVRCGKSCRLRWINYLRPDIKRGNFSKEEEETIIQLHDMLGNRWSAIAARLPGRTDNEIKNVWHTHLKKKLNNREEMKKQSKHAVKINFEVPQDNNSAASSAPGSPSHSSSEFSSLKANLATPAAAVPIKVENIMDGPECFVGVDESFCSELPGDDANLQEENKGVVVKKEVEFQFPLFSLEEAANAYTSRLDDSMEFWYDLLIRTGDLPDLPQF